MRGRPAERYTTVREFGAVGNGLSYALGVAAARWQGREGKIVLFEGDGGLLFHIQELETLKRQGFRILICAMNDGGYGMAAACSKSPEYGHSSIKQRSQVR